MTHQILGDRYQVQQQLGRSAGRQTLLARDLETQELVVIKLLSFGSDFAWEHLKLFEREAEILQTLSHPAIPRYLNYFEQSTPNGQAFALVQTYIPGKSLEEQLKIGRRFSEAQVKQLAKALLEILIYLHSLQPPVIHRDIKPSNILLSGDSSDDSVGQVYLVDFGSVQTLAAKESQTITVVGTYGYMPPEQFGGRTVPASDLYSLGATLIAVVTGTHPADLPMKDGRIQFEQAVSITPALRNWLRWMTEPSLDRRLASAQAALDALEQRLTNPASLLVKQPTGSKVLLTQKEDSLEILIPPSGLNPHILSLSLFATAWITFLIVWTGVALSAPWGINIFFALFSLPFWGAGITMLRTILFALFGRTRLAINQEQISLSYEVLGFKYRRPRPEQRHHITKLERTKTSQINIWAGNYKYQLGSDGLLTEPELEWLSYELSAWLGMPLAEGSSA